MKTANCRDKFFKPIQDPLFSKFKTELKEISEQEPEKLVIEASELKKKLTKKNVNKT